MTAYFHPFCEIWITLKREQNDVRESLREHEIHTKIDSVRLKEYLVNFLKELQKYGSLSN